MDNDMEVLDEIDVSKSDVVLDVVVIDRGKRKLRVSLFDKKVTKEGKGDDGKGDDGKGVDFLKTAKKMGMTFPRPRWRSNDFGLWRVKMRCLLIQHGWEAALDPFPETMADTEKTAALKTDVYKKAHSALLLCLDNKVLREVNKQNYAAGVWLKLETLYMTKSLANKLYLKKKLFTIYMHSCKKLSEHIDEFNKLIGDLANIDVDIDDEYQALMLLTSLPSSYDNFEESRSL
nr:retrovirus-related Pol polyprotein from transposon TNT 1-94 [Tanacetum cinerariifolium]